MFWSNPNKLKLPTTDESLHGRKDRMRVAPRHFVSGAEMEAAHPGKEVAIFGMGCFWGAERKFWSLPGVVVTAVGYAGGHTPNPTYEEVCSGRTGHTEAVLVAYDPKQVSYDDLLRVFWEGHDPTQGNDVGTQYRSAIYYANDAQKRAAESSLEKFQLSLKQAGFGPVTSELAPAGEFYFAEDYHQQYLAKNPRGYCGLGGTGVSCPI